MSLQTIVVITEEYLLYLIDELTGTTEYLTPYTKCRVNHCRYNQVLLYIPLF
jgi:hypothetical protein